MNDYRPDEWWRTDLNQKRQGWMSDEGVIWFLAVVAVIALCMALTLRYW